MRCHNCGRQFISGGVRDQSGTFCSTECHYNFAHPRFCNACISATTATRAKDALTVIPYGYRFLRPGDDRCETCGSVVQSQWFCILFIPVFRVGTFRVKYVTPYRFLSREIPKKPKG